jgi:hypothetical protein
MDELLQAGSVPTFGSAHTCPLKFKAFVIEKWLEGNLLGPIRHSFGYNADERQRIHVPRR